MICLDQEVLNGTKTLAKWCVKAEEPTDSLSSLLKNLTLKLAGYGQA